MASVQVGSVTSEDWRSLIGDDPEPWGHTGENLVWGDKDQAVTARDDDGRLCGTASSVIVPVRVAGGDPFDVLGIGGVFVRADQRGCGLAHELLERLLELGRERPCDRAMLFCREGLMGLYAGFGFAAIEDEVWAEQPGGPIEIPLRAMWVAFERGREWPPGRVDVLALPF